MDNQENKKSLPKTSLFKKIASISNVTWAVILGALFILLIMVQQLPLRNAVCPSVCQTILTPIVLILSLPLVLVPFSANSQNQTYILDIMSDYQWILHLPLFINFLIIYFLILSFKQKSKKVSKAFKTIAIIILSIEIVFVAGFFVFQNFIQGSSADQETIKQKSVDNSDPSICKQAKKYVFNGGDYVDRVSKQEAIDSCYSYYARNKPDIEVCSKLSSGSCTEDSIYSNCIAVTVKKNLNVYSGEDCEMMKLRQTDCATTHYKSCLLSVRFNQK